MKNKIAVFTNGFSGEFIEYVITGMQKKAEIDSVDIFVFVSYCNFVAPELQNKCQLNLFHLPNPEDFDGAIMLTNTFNFPYESERVCARFQRAGVPMLSLEVEIPHMSCIKSENYKGVRALAQHLVEHHNAKKIMYVNGIEGNVENSQRRQALVDVLDEHKMKLFYEIQSDFSFYSAFLNMNDYLDSGKELPDAIVCGNDHMAIGVHSSLTNHGYTVPDDVIVTGFDMIKESQCTFPIFATVSRGWDKYGEMAYDKLKYQIEHPKERFLEINDSFFVPSESCGCKASDSAEKNRFFTIRNLYYENVLKDIMDIAFQRLQVPLAMAERKEDFYDKGFKVVRDVPDLGPSYCICTEPAFFELDNDEYPERIRGYSDNMDILYELRDGKKQPIGHFNSKELYPNYKHKVGESNVYVFAPLNHSNFIIGYVAIKNSPKLLFNSDLYKFISNLDALLFTMRVHIFSERTNRELKKIYMNDALTGIYNRTGCEQVLYNYILEQKEKKERSMLVFADIDRMKTINDVYGHLNGDFAIKATAEAFKKHAPKDWLFGRYGGDEFIAVGSCPPDEEIPDFIKNISESMTADFKSLNLAFMLHASIGYVVIEPDDDGTIDDYINSADKVMYAEKEKYHEIIDSLQKKKNKNKQT